MLRTQRKPDIVFPSFAAMSHELQKDTLRLPSYRESVFFRFHPYPQTRRRPVDHLMQRVDYRSVEQPVANARGEDPVPMQEERDLTDEDAVNLNLAMNTSATEKPHVKKRRSLTSLIIDLAVAVTNSRRLKRRRSAL
ncbi:hypothetical protein GSI_13761 [Ganoderma sinense ZZ0214-1]|uniref:Uncharacterized protein n=1 Tax=Ganoderma sinense ZZ0214-1 TaxID=1077348 RepID=A0A2G8RR69_9APHY|nr:hypothetical protein GSI_13761 [Ganoderma sinense ZZ0214-1]